MSLLCFLFCSPHFIFFHEAFFCFLVFVVFASASFFSVAEPLFFLSTLLLCFALCLFFSSCLVLAPSLLFFDKTFSCLSWCVYFLAVLCPLLLFFLSQRSLLPDIAGSNFTCRLISSPPHSALHVWLPSFFGCLDFAI